MIEILKSMGVQHNVTFRVLDALNGRVISEHIGHNQATNSLLLGIAHYLKGDGVLNQGSHMLNSYIPKYISLGTMGLINQECDELGLPTGIGVSATGNRGVPLTEQERFEDYMAQAPGYGADGYDANQNNNRVYLGLGPAFANRDTVTSTTPMTVRCELISSTFPRSPIMHRSIIPEVESEIPETIDVVYSAMVSTGALAQFREPGKDYVFITEAGLWSRPDWTDVGANGLLAGYRIIPPDEDNWDMSIKANRDLLKQQIIRVGINQIVQIVWKIQLGAINQFCNPNQHHDSQSMLRWQEVT